ncbi:MAG: hypothetical protein R2856_11870 [Caldilineaceae bacterium]
MPKPAGAKTGAATLLTVPKTLCSGATSAKPPTPIRAGTDKSSHTAIDASRIVVPAFCTKPMVRSIVLLKTVFRLGAR